MTKMTATTKFLKIFGETFVNRNGNVVPLPLHLGMHRECGRRLSEGQASLPPRSPCTTLANK
jgi:hypothetical protein